MQGPILVSVIHVFRSALVVLLLAAATSVSAHDGSVFEPYLGRWVGDGRLGMRGGETEQVKCRVTYIRGATLASVKQSIRCASAAGSIEVQSEVTESEGILTGTWKEHLHDLSGDVTGTASERGLRLRIRSQNFSANMSIALREERQVIEIHFIEGTLIGLTLSLTRG